jgi:hypothetical protein
MSGEETRLRSRGPGFDSGPCSFSEAPLLSLLRIFRARPADTVNRGWSDPCRMDCCPGKGPSAIQQQSARLLPEAIGPTRVDGRQSDLAPRGCCWKQLAQQRPGGRLPAPSRATTVVAAATGSGWSSSNQTDGSGSPPRQLLPTGNRLDSCRCCWCPTNCFQQHSHGRRPVYDWSDWRRADYCRAAAGATTADGAGRTIADGCPSETIRRSLPSRWSAAVSRAVVSRGRLDNFGDRPADDCWLGPGRRLATVLARPLLAASSPTLSEIARPTAVRTSTDRCPDWCPSDQASDWQQSTGAGPTVAGLLSAGQRPGGQRSEGVDRAGRPTGRGRLPVALIVCPT